MATLPGAWHYRVSTGTGQPSVSILWLGEVEHVTCNFCLIVAAYKLAWADCPWDTLACCWDVKQPSKTLVQPPSPTSYHSIIVVAKSSCRLEIAPHPPSVAWDGYPSLWPPQWNKDIKRDLPSDLLCVPNSASAIQSRALVVLAVRQQNICCSPAPSASHSVSGQTTLP